MSRAARVRWILASVLALAAGVGAAVAVAAGLSPTTIGHVDTSITSAVYNDTQSRIWVQDPDPVGRSFAASDTGVITEWSIGLFRVMANDPTVALKVVRAGGSPGVYSVVGTDTHTAGPIRNTPQVLTFQTRIPVQAGDRLGAYTDSAAWLGSSFAPSTPEAVVHGPATSATVGETVTLATTYTNIQMRLAAEIEPDADGDGFGDLTQDACPAKASKQAAPCEDATTTTTTTAGTTTAATTAAPVAAAATCRVPRLKGVTRATAVKRLRAAGCRLGTVRLTKAARRATGPAKRRLVVVTAPKAGSRRPADSGVPLTLGPPKRR